jgi:hypothetical protein
VHAWYLVIVFRDEESQVGFPKLEARICLVKQVFRCRGGIMWGGLMCGHAGWCKGGKRCGEVGLGGGV